MSAIKVDVSNSDSLDRANFLYVCLYIYFQFVMILAQNML